MNKNAVDENKLEDLFSDGKMFPDIQKYKNVSLFFYFF